jgi:hypothetical protein
VRASIGQQFSTPRASERLRAFERSGIGATAAATDATVRGASTAPTDQRTKRMTTARCAVSRCDPVHAHAIEWADVLVLVIGGVTEHLRLRGSLS